MASEGKEIKRKCKRPTVHHLFNSLIFCLFATATAVAVDAPQAKKTKKSKAPSAKLTKDDVAATPIPAAKKVEAPTSAKVKPRKRAADFLSDEEEGGGGVALKASEAAAPQPGKPKKKNSTKNKAAVNGNANETAVQAEEAPKTATPDPSATAANAATELKPKPKKTKAVPEHQDTSTKIEKTATSSRPKKKGPSTVDIHAEKIKKLLSQKDELPKPNTKAKKTDNAIPADLTTDGVNGVSTNAVDESLQAATNDAAPTTMQAEVQQMTERELEEEYGSDDELDQAGALLEGFDSDTEDPAQDVGLDKDKPTAALPNYKKTQKKLRQAAQKGNKEGPGAVYVGRIPHGFYENEMRQYFSQFGTITKLRLSRNRKTGQPKHFAFLEFESTEVAKIVAETMNNYLMFGHILKCKYVQPESLHPDTFKGANKRFRVVPRNKMEKRALEAPKTESQWKKKNEKEQAKREKKAEKLSAMGYEIELPKLKSPEEVLQKKQLQSVSEEQVPDMSKTDENETPAPSAAPKDEVATSKKSNGVNKEKMAPAETNGASIQSTVLKDETSEPTKPQDSHEPAPEKQKKRKEKREKAKGEANQPVAPFKTNERRATEKEEADGESADAKPEPAPTNRSSKPRKKKNKNATAQPATDETPSALATAKPEPVIVDEAALSSTVLPATVEDSKSKKTRQKRKNNGTDDDVAGSALKTTEPATGTADAKKEQVNGEARTKRILKRAKKA